jgi:hypothetical protein
MHHLLLTVCTLVVACQANKLLRVIDITLNLRLTTRFKMKKLILTIQVHEKFRKKLLTRSNQNKQKLQTIKFQQSSKF